MKPSDFRDAKWEELQPRLGRMRRVVYAHWLLWGPTTTRNLAEKSGINLLVVRPRTTELFQIGLLRLTKDQPGGTEGVYEHVTKDEWEALIAGLNG